MPENVQLTSVHDTAFKAAALRAAHVLVGSEPKIFEDTLALSITGLSEQDVITLCKRVGPARASTCVTRSRVTEDALAASLKRGVDQYVVLGAGLDTYALRMADKLGALTVYEIDDPVFLRWKQNRIEQVGLKSPRQLRYAPCDFETMSIADALASTSFNADKPVFISWLGVTQYLTREAVRATLKWAGERPVGSEIALSYDDSGANIPNVIAEAAGRGVTLHFFPTPEEITALLREAGFTKITHQTREQATESFFKNRADGLIAPECQKMVVAIK